MPDTLAQRIRAKYPGAYDDLDDQTLETSIRTKYPGVYDDIPLTTAAAPAPKPQTAQGSTFGEKIQHAAQWLDSVRTGVDKKAASTALGLAEFAGKIPNVFNPAAGNLGESVDALYGTPGLSKTAVSTGREGMAYQNTPERIGGAIGTVGEMLMPVTEGAAAVKEAIPTAAKAGAKFQEVMGAARNIPIDVNAPGEVALRIQQLGERGGSMPRAVSQFLRRITDPDKAEMTYEEARDFASNISRLSANEFQRLTPAIAREVAGLRVTLNRAVADAAGKAGKGKEYAEAMTEYGRAKRIEGIYNAFIDGAKKGAPWATAAAAGGWLGSKLRAFLPE